VTPSYLWPPAGGLDQRVLFGNRACPLPRACTPEQEAKLPRHGTRSARRFDALPRGFTLREMSSLLDMDIEVARSQMRVWLAHQLIDVVSKGEQPVYVKVV